MKIREGESIVTAFPAYLNNSIVVVIEGADGKLRTECMPEHMHSPTIAALYSICATAHNAMMVEVHKVLTKKRRGK